MPITSAEEYQRASDLVTSGQAKDPARLKLSMSAFRRYNPQLGHESPVEGFESTSYGKELLTGQVKGALKDDSLKSASRLKVFGGQTEYEPWLDPGYKPPVRNPFSALGGGIGSPSMSADQNEAITSHAWHEPTLKEFRAALAEGGPLATKAKKELGAGAFGDDLPQEAPGPGEHAAPRVKDITQIGNKPLDPEKLPDATLEQSEAFKAYRDAAWNHALADAIKEQKPIYRLDFSPKLTEADRTIARASDTAGAGVSGGLQSMSLGLMDPLQRAINPKWAEANRNQRLRHPTAEMTGEVAGSLVGAPEAIARGTAKTLGKGLGESAGARLATSVGAGAVTGAVDMQTRAIAQAAADALDAGDSAVEMAHRIYDALSPKTTLAGAAIGGGMGLGGHAVGSVLNSGARRIVTSGEQGPIVENNLGSGGEMDWKGNIKMEPRLDTLRHGAAAENKFADEVLAENAVDPIATHQLEKQEAGTRQAEAETALAHERLGEATVDTKPFADRVLQIAKDIPGLTPKGKNVQAAIRRWARKVRSQGTATPRELDLLEQEVADQAKFEAGKVDPHWNEVAKALKDSRDEFQFNEPTANYSIRDKLGNTKVVSGLSAMKKSQETALRAAKFENRQLGLPESLSPAPTKLGRLTATDEEAGQFIANHKDLPSVVKYLNEERAAASRLERGQTPSDLTPARVNSAMQATTGANRALRDAVTAGHVYDGTVFRGAAMPEAKIQEMIAKGEVKNDSIWSAAREKDYALGFAKKAAVKGRHSVVFEIDSRSAVPLDNIPGSETFDELAIPIGERFKVTDSYRNPDGLLVVKLSKPYPSLDDLATADRPKVSLDYDQRQTAKQSLMNIGNPGGNLPKKLAVATEAGVGKQVGDIVKLRDRQNYRQLLGGAFQGISAGPGRIGNKYIKSAQLLRAVPTLKSLGGGLGKPGRLPAMEASDELVSLIDRYTSDLGSGEGRAHVGKRIMSEMVPEARALNLRGGQTARPTGALMHDEKAKGAPLTPEEAAVASAVIRELLKQERALQ
jgi:hypothetical protein